MIKEDNQVWESEGKCLYKCFWDVTLSVPASITCFFMTRERYLPRSDSANSMWSDLKALSKNSQWCIIVIFNILLLTAVVTRGSSTIYYMNYVLLRPDLVFTFIITGMIAALCGAFFSERLLGKFDRVRTYQICLASFVFFVTTIYFIPPSQVWLIIAVNIVFGFVQNLTTPIQWNMFSDVVDFQEQRSGRRLDGLVFSTALFAIKFGLAMGGAVVGWILGLVHYQPGVAAQTPRVITTINLMHNIIPGVLFTCMLLLLFLYKLNSARVNAIALELAAKHAAEEKMDASKTI